METIKQLNDRQKRYIQNKERELTLSRAYYANNKEKINMKHRCECGGCFTLNNLSNHKNTRRHIGFTTNTGIFAYPLYKRVETHQTPADIIT